MHPVIYSGDFQWNVDCSVGQNGQNSRPDDVSYVQWYYKRAGSFDAVDPQRRAIYAAVAVTGKCTGRPDDPLCRAILAHQIHLNHPEKDGRVSVATGAGKVGASHTSSIGSARGSRTCTSASGRGSTSCRTARRSSPRPSRRLCRRCDPAQIAAARWKAGRAFRPS